MEFITIARVDDPAVSRSVSAQSFKHWPKAKGFDDKVYRYDGRNVWQIADEEAVAKAMEVVPAERQKIKVPDEIQVIRSSKTEEVTEAPHEVSDVEETDAELVLAEALQAPKEPAKRGPKPKAK